MKDRSIAIVLGTYFGEKYIRTQIESIQSQAVTHWKLFIRDEDSQDRTQDIIDEYANHDPRIVRIKDNKGRLGVIQNYNQLMRHMLKEEPDFIFFADQDDFWLPEKLELQINRLEAMEREFGKETPLLVHSDLRVVDEQLNLINNSFMAYQGLRHIEKKPFESLLIQNFITGCATAINLPLLKTALPLPETALMHDWWIALCAAAFGKIGFVNEATLLYRQHGGNEVGAKGIWGPLNPFSPNFLMVRWNQSKKNLLKTIYQAKSMAEKISAIDANRFDHEMRTARIYSELLTHDRIKRPTKAYKAGIRGQWLYQVILSLWLCLLPHQSNLNR